MLGQKFEKLKRNVQIYQSYQNQELFQNQKYSRSLYADFFQ